MSNFTIMGKIPVVRRLENQAGIYFECSNVIGDENDSELAEHAISRLERELDCEIIPLSIDEVRDLADFFCFLF